MKVYRLLYSLEFIRHLNLLWCWSTGMTSGKTHWFSEQGDFGLIGQTTKGNRLSKRESLFNGEKSTGKLLFGNIWFERRLDDGCLKADPCRVLQVGDLKTTSCGLTTHNSTRSLHAGHFLFGWDRNSQKKATQFANLSPVVPCGQHIL